MGKCVHRRTDNAKASATPHCSLPINDGRNNWFKLVSKKECQKKFVDLKEKRKKLQFQVRENVQKLKLIHDRRANDTIVHHCLEKIIN